VAVVAGVLVVEAATLQPQQSESHQVEYDGEEAK
jgi:hypothetical protein